MINTINGANEKQLETFNGIVSAAMTLKDDGAPLNKVYSLVGSAGTGKTWILTQIIKEVLSHGIKVAMTTPTHKALSVVTDMLTEAKITDPNLITGTIHYFLNLKLDYGFGDDGSADNVTTKPKLVINKFNECLQYTDLLIIDESSMVSEELYKLTMGILDDRCKMILFVGDKYQLLPIEGGENIIYDHPEIMHYQLTETVRQKEGSSIIEKANEIRDYIKYGNHPDNIFELFHETDEIKLLHENEFLPDYFENEHIKMIGSFTNVMVDQYNAYVRYVDTKELNYLAAGDEVVFQKPYSNASGELIFQNGETVEVQSTKKVFDDKNSVWYWRCKGNSRMFNVLDPESTSVYKDKLKELLDFAKTQKGYNKSNAWKVYFKLMNRFGIIKYSYASTLHKLQGSTTESMYFDMRDLKRFYTRDKEGVLRLIYVAITRPSLKLHILGM